MSTDDIRLPADPRVPVGRRIVVHRTQNPRDPYPWDEKLSPYDECITLAWQAVVVAVGPRCDAGVAPGDRVTICRGRGDLLGTRQLGTDVPAVDPTYFDVLSVDVDDVVARTPSDRDLGESAHGAEVPSTPRVRGSDEAGRDWIRECAEETRHYEDECDRMRPVVRAAELVSQCQTDAGQQEAIVTLRYQVDRYRVAHRGVVLDLLRKVYAGDAGPDAVADFVHRWGSRRPQVVEDLIDQIDPSLIPADPTAGPGGVGRALLAGTRLHRDILQSESRHRLLLRFIEDLRVRGASDDVISRIR